MNQRQCRQLDAFLLGDLSDRQRDAFQVHLENCDACRHQLKAQHRIDSLLARERCHLAPEKLRARLRQDDIRYARQRTTRRRLAAAVPIAAAVAAVALWSLDLLPWPRDSKVRESQPVARGNSEDDPPLAIELPAVETVAVVESDDMIAVPLASGSAEVTIVQLYPTTLTERRRRFEAALEALLESKGG